MKELWELATSAPMLPLTILLVPVGIYWLLSALGAVDHDLFGVDLDSTGDGAADGAHHHHDHPSLEWVHSTLRILNARGVPVMIVLSVLIIYLWGCAMLGNLWFNGGLAGGIGGLVGIGALVIAIVLTRLTMAPLKPLFRLIQDDPENAEPAVGRTGIVRTAWVNEREGQIEVENRGAPLLLNARTAEGAAPQPRGTVVLIIRHDSESGLHFVRPLSEQPSESTHS